jgi:glycosyltransferase involved in cell wall biosynthesis
MSHPPVNAPVSSPKPPLTIIICTRNPRQEYFAQCLTALEMQTLRGDEWELVLVDNASLPDKTPQPNLSWHPQARLVREEQVGLTPARLRGIREASGELLVFVDDDKVLECDFLETALRIAKERPYLGSWSGQCRPRFEESPPEWTRRYWVNLAVREFDKDWWSNLPRLADTMPCGAGLCVRREVAQRYLFLNDTGKRSFQYGRTGDSLISGEDSDLAACACDLGFGVGIVSSLRLTHLIPPERLTEDYLARLAEGIHFSSVLLDCEYGIRSLHRGMLGRVADFLRTMRTKNPHRRILKAAFRGRNRALRQLAFR